MSTAGSDAKPSPRRAPWSRGRTVSPWIGALPVSTTKGSSPNPKSARNAACASDTKAASRFAKTWPRAVKPPEMAPTCAPSTCARLSPCKASQILLGAMCTLPRKKLRCDVR